MRQEHRARRRRRGAARNPAARRGGPEFRRLSERTSASCVDEQHLPEHATRTRRTEPLRRTPVPPRTSAAYVPTQLGAPVKRLSHRSQKSLRRADRNCDPSITLWHRQAGWTTREVLRGDPSQPDASIGATGVERRRLASDRDRQSSSTWPAVRSPRYDGVPFPPAGAADDRDTRSPAQGSGRPRPDTTTECRSGDLRSARRAAPEPTIRRIATPPQRQSGFAALQEDGASPVWC